MKVELRFPHIDKNAPPTVQVEQMRVFLFNLVEQLQVVISNLPESKEKPQEDKV